MSAKQQLAEIVASLPESTSLEEAFERLYQAFKEKLSREAARGGGVHPRLVAPPRRHEQREPFPTIDTGNWPVELSLRREDIYGDDGR